MQIGAEPSPDCGTHGQAQCGGCYVCSMVGVFREVRRVLRGDGTVWLNLGDTWTSGGRATYRSGASNNKGHQVQDDLGRPDAGLPQGNLVGIPWRVALALQADGWILRSDIIWHSPNKMPESVTNRCTKSYEHIFLLAKCNDYYYDAVAIEEPAKESSQRREAAGFVESERDEEYKNIGGVDGRARLGLREKCGIHATANKRDVWIVPTQGYKGAHFATYSPRLITPCILAGTSEYGCCAACGAPYERVVARTDGRSAMDDGACRRTPPGQEPHSHHCGRKDRDRSFPSQRNGKAGSGSTLDTEVARRETAGWRKVCGCRTDEVLPAVVLDPFVGSGTTVATAVDLGRRGVGVDLSEAYLRDHAVPRVEAAIAAASARAPKPAVVFQPDVPPAPTPLR